MTYKYIHKTPKEFSDMIMNSDGEYLTGLWFENSRDSSKHKIDCEEKDLEILKKTSKWLDIYFGGKAPNFTPKYKIENLTSFRQEVIDIMNSIEHGKTLTYSDISKIIAKKKRFKKNVITSSCWHWGRWPVSEYVYEFNTVTEADFTEPDISEYKVQ